MKSTIFRVGGVTAVLGGLYLLIFFIVQAFNRFDIDDGGFFWQTIPLMPIFLTIGAAGLLALADGHKGVQMGVVVMGLGAVVMAVGFAMMTWLGADNGWLVMGLGLILHPIGFLLFGLANWRTRVLPRWNGVPLIVGIITCLLLILGILGRLVGLTEQQGDQVFAVFLLTLAVGWLLLGVDMVISRRETAVPITTMVP
jgi:hypothetical protein